MEEKQTPASAASAAPDTSAPAEPHDTAETVGAPAPLSAAASIAALPPPTPAMRILRRVGFVLACILLAVVLLLGGYVVYLMLQYSRIDDNTPLAVQTPQTAVLQQGKAYTAVTYNIGFGAYDPEYSFFMDTGNMADGTPVAGKYGKARSKSAAQTNTTGSVAALRTLAPDFALVQEADKDATRSYRINQVQAVTQALPAYASTYASNFHSAFLALPLNDMHGKVEAGLVTLSRYQISEAVRRSYPVDDGFPTKFFDLDRCFTQLRLPVQDASGKDTGKQLVLINSHMSAYDKGGTIRAQQLALLNSVLEAEAQRGNYVIVGGDFNHALYGSEDTFPSQQQFPAWVSILTPDDLADGFTVVEPANSQTVATCRTCDLPYEKGVNYTVSVDGFIVSDNVKATAENVDLSFAYSDHNPVKLSFSLVA